MLQKEAGQLLETNINLVYAICRRFFMRWDEAEEAVQHTAIRVLKYSSQAPTSAPVKWLALQARYACMDIVKARRDSIPLDYITLFGYKLASQGAPAARGDLEDVPLWQQLTVDEQDLLELIDSGYSRRAASEALGWSHSLADYYINRLRKRLTK